MRQSVIKEGKLLLENQEKKLKQIENLNCPDKEAPDTAYMEADATYINLQHRGKKKKEKMEVKVGVGYTGKEARYSSGKSKRLKEKFTFIGTGKDFMEKLSLLAEERFSLSKVKKVICLCYSKTAPLYLKKINQSSPYFLLSRLTIIFVLPAIPWSLSSGKNYHSY